VTNTLLLVAYTVFSVAGLLLLKLGAPALRSSGLLAADWKPLVQVGTGAALYITAFLVWICVLSRIELSVAYPVAIGLTLVFLSAASIMILGEPIGVVRIIGIGLIFSGIVLVTRI
jgi:multidrug transporter EmrE-like cation transporter